jgi:hypothetical protein
MKIVLIIAGLLVTIIVVLVLMSQWFGKPWGNK